MATNRRIIAFSKVEYVVLRDGVNMLIRKAQSEGDEFKLVYAESVRDHLQTVINKFDE